MAAPTPVFESGEITVHLFRGAGARPRSLIWLIPLFMGLAACAPPPDTFPAQSTDPHQQELHQLYVDAYQNGDPQAMRKLAYIFSTGQDGLYNPAGARDLYSRLMSQGDRDAVLRLADSYLWSAPKNYQKALALYQKAAADGNTDANIGLWYMYLHGLGVQRDDAKVQDYFQKGAATKEGALREFMMQMREAVYTQGHYPYFPAWDFSTGGALVGFDYTGNGKATNVEIDRSSGNMDLDKEAIQMVQDADLPPIPDALGGIHHFRIVVNFGRS